MEVADRAIPLSTVKSDMLAYIAGPYTARNKDGSENHALTAERMRITSLCIAKLMEREIKSCSPMLMHMVRGHVPSLPGDWKYWGEYSMIMLNRCDVVIVLKIDGWEESAGVDAETILAESSGIPVIFVDPVELIGQAAIDDKYKEDGTILVKVSKIRSPIARRLAIAGSFVPILVINTFLIIATCTGAFLKSPFLLMKTAKKFW